MVTNFVLQIACLMVSVYLFSNSICIPALSNISEHFTVSPRIAQNIIVLYTLGLGVSQLFYGPLSDIYGRRIVVLVGNTIFVFGSIFSLFSSSIDSLLLARLLQGLGAGCYSVIAKSILSDVYKGNFYINATAVVMIISVLTQMISPIIGGYLISLFSWQANFLAILLYCLITLVVLFIFMPETNFHERTGSKNNVFLAMYHSYSIILQQKDFWLFLLISSLTLACVTIYYGVSPFILQNQMGLSSFEFGLTFLLTDSTFLIGCLFIYYVKNKVNAYKNMLVGLSIMTIGSGMMILTSILKYNEPVLIIFSMSVFNLGTGLVFPVATAKALLVRQNIPGASGAIIGAIQMLIVALLVFAFSGIHGGNQCFLALILFMMTMVCFFFAGKLNEEKAYRS